MKNETMERDGHEHLIKVLDDVLASNLQLRSESEDGHVEGVRGRNVCEWLVGMVGDVLGRVWMDSTIY
jgi:hypothetical protein